LRLPALRLLPSLRARAARPAKARYPRTPHLRRRLLLLLVLVSLVGGGYMFWFRDSSLVRVERVNVIGLSTAPGASRLRVQLTAAARGMTTLHANAAALRRVVADDPVVRAIHIRTDFPHGLTIDVTENRPVALVSTGGRSVPEVRTVSMPDGRRLARGAALDRVIVAGAAPPALLGRVASITIQPGRGFVAQLENGPSIWLGTRYRIEDKWTAAAAVLAQSSSKGATYVDVRMPDRPAAGGLTVTDEPQQEADPSAAASPDTPAPIPADPGADPAAQAPQAATATPAPPATQTAPQATPAAPDTGTTQPQP
jgi:cell division protein FtsQ